MLQARLKNGSNIYVGGDRAGERHGDSGHLKATILS